MFGAMKIATTLLTAACLLGSFTFAASAAVNDERLYEMRTYYAAPGKLDDLHARFRNHTMRLFEKHGLVNLGYWVPLENPENKLIYVIAAPSREARDASFKAFGSDPEWKKAQAESEANGKLVAKIEEQFMKATDYSPMIKPGMGGGKRVFELRTYTTTPEQSAAARQPFSRSHREPFQETRDGQPLLLASRARAEGRGKYAHLHPRPRDAGNGEEVL